MSWNMSVLLVQVETSEKSYKAFLDGLGVGNATFREKLPFDDAIDAMSETGEGAAIGSAEGWTSVWGELFFVGREALARLAKTASTYSLMFDGNTDTLAFEAWMGGEQRRHRVSQAGDVSSDNGDPLPVEAAVFEEDPDDAEEQAFSLMNALSIPHRRLTKPKFHVFDLEE